MPNIVLTCKGDNKWREEFEYERHALWFLVGLLSDNERYFHSTSDYQDLVFDIEDDCILWEQDGKIRSCPGWNWAEGQDYEPIMMGEKSLYALFAEISEC